MYINSSQLDNNPQKNLFQQDASLEKIYNGGSVTVQS
jgi:hypothetical protein